MKYLKLADNLRAEISKGSFSSTKLLPDTLALAEKYRVSPVTVTKAVQLLADEGLVRRIKSKGTFVQSQKPSDFLHLQKKKRIAFLFRGSHAGLISTHYQAQAFVAVDDLVRATGHSIIPLPLEGRPISEYVRLIDAERVSGVLMYAFYNKELYAAIKTQKLSCVFLDHIDFGLSENQITTDHSLGGAISLRKLVELGHREICFLGHENKLGRRDPDHALWASAISTEAQAFGLPKVQTLFTPFEKIGEMRERIRKWIKKHRCATGYVCASTTFYELLNDIIMHDPEIDNKTRDCVLFSDWREEKLFNGRKLWQCRWDTAEMGKMAAVVLLELMQGGPYKPRIHYLPVEIV
ncbi:MAG: GntR family transcriptional regulator [Fibrobacteres bacterium]|nr:GntR family transcriptional regulator [Fibrobacterota bacterium]